MGFFATFQALIPGCKPRPADKPTKEMPIEVAGCAAITKKPNGRTTCEVGETRTLRIVLPPGVATPQVSSRDAGIAAQVDGATVVVDVPPMAPGLVVTATLRDAPASATIELAPSARPAWLEEARRIRSEGDFDRSAAVASAHVEGGSAIDRAFAKGFLARLALARGRSDDAFPLFHDAIAIHRAEGRVSDAADDSFALAFALHQRSQRYTEARSVLDAVVGDVLVYPEGKAREPYYRGVLASETGDHRRALALLRDAERLSRQYGMTRLERNARSALALEMQQLGRADASLPILQALETELDAASSTGKGEVPTPCERIEAANNRGWGALLVNEAAAADGKPATADVRTPLERALAIPGCADLYLRSSALGNLARLSLAEGDVATSEARLGEAKASIKNPRGTERLEWLELEARQLVARGRASAALKVLDEGLALARASLLRVQEWSLLVARSEALTALHQNKEAIITLGAAEDVLDDATLLVPLGEGRGGFTGGRSRSARSLIGLLVASGDVARAAEVGQRAQARVLSAVEGALRIERLAPPQRAKWEEAVRAFRSARAAIDADASGDWKLPADALARAVAARAKRESDLRSALEAAMALIVKSTPPRKPEPRAASVLELDIHPDLRGFVAITQIGATATAKRLDADTSVDPGELSRSLFDPIDAAIAAATLIRVRAYGAWRAVDIHALPWHGEPLVDHVPVEYAIGNASRTDRGGDKIVVVGDPTSDLPGAFEEAKDVARALERRYSKVRLLVRDEATSLNVLAALTGATTLHYAGHGVFAGEEGWESALPLAAGGRLTAPDVLALSPAPRAVVLTGCEAAKSVGAAEGLGLAQAFIVAGSNEVLAPVRPVADVLASRLAAALYAEGDGGPPSELLSVRARKAVLSVRAADPVSDWAAFRVLVP